MVKNYKGWNTWKIVHRWSLLLTFMYSAYIDSSWQACKTFFSFRLENFFDGFAEHFLFPQEFYCIVAVGIYDIFCEFIAGKHYCIYFTCLIWISTTSLLHMGSQKSPRPEILAVCLVTEKVQVRGWGSCWILKHAPILLAGHFPDLWFLLKLQYNFVFNLF